MKNKIDSIMAEIDNEWIDMELGFRASGYFGNAELKPKHLVLLAQEIEQDILELGKEIAYWKERIKNNRGNTEIRKEAKVIMGNLVKEKETLLWRIKTCTSLGQKLKKSSEKEKKEAGPSSQQD